MAANLENIAPKIPASSSAKPLKKSWVSEFQGSGAPGRSVRSPPSRLAAEAFVLEGGEVVGPAFIVLGAELVQVIPGVNPGVVEIVELDAHRVIADRFEIDDPDMGALADDRLLPGAVALQFGR